MAAGDLITADWQVEFRGLLMGDTTELALVQIEGLLDVDNVTSADRARLRRHGLHAGDDFLAGRSITLTIEVYAATDADMSSRVAELQTAFQPGTDLEPLVLRIPGFAGGEKVRVEARTRRRQLSINNDFLYRLPVFTVQLDAIDPRVYSNAETSISANVATTGSGLTWPLVWPLTWGAAGASGAMQATNAGTFPTSPVFKFDGPVTNPSIENITTGETLAFTGALLTGEYLLVDTEERTVLLNGTASRYSWLNAGSVWFDLEPGVNELIYRGATAGTSLCTVTYRSARV